MLCAVQSETERDRVVCCVQCSVRLRETEMCVCVCVCVQCRVRLRETEMCVMCSAE